MKFMEKIEDILNRLRRVEGQVRGIQNMIRERRDCEKVLQQVSAARSALFKAGTLYLVANLEKCTEDLKECPPEIRDEVKKIIKVFSRYA